MFYKRLLIRLLTSFLFLVVILLPSPVSAEVKEIIAEGTYIMGDSETPSVAQERAIVEAKRAAIEQAGTYLESFTEVKNMQLTSDEIKVFASGLIETTVLDKKRDVVDGEAFKVWVKVRCTVSTDNVQSMKNKIQDKQNLETLKKIQDDYAKAMQEIAELKHKLTLVTTNQEKKQFEVKIAQTEQSFTAIQWADKGYDYAVNKKDYDNAIVAFSKAIEINPYTEYFFNNRGNAYAEKKQHALAIADFSKAITLNPQIATSYNNRGISYRDMRQYALAIADFSRAIELDYPNATYYSNRGNIYAELRQYTFAIADFNKAIQVNPRYASAYNNRGNLYSSNKQYDLALADFNTAIELEPNATTYSLRGKCHALLKQYAEAISDFNKAIEIKPQSELYVNRGIVYKNMGMPDLAIEDYNKAISFVPNDARIYSNRGVAYAVKGQYQLALSDFDQSISLDSRQLGVYINKAITYEKLGRNADAIDTYKLYLVNAPENDPNIEQIKQNIRKLGGAM